MAGGVKNAKSSGKTRFKVVKPGLVWERILVQIVRVWARLSRFSSNLCSKAVQNDHIDPKYVSAA